MSKKIVKLAIIRDNENSKCPFGLPIPFGCNHAGDVVDRMAPISILKEPIEKDEQKLSAANVRLLSWSLMDRTYAPTRCKYAAKIFEDQGSVECNYNDIAPGEMPGSLTPYPDYSQIFSGEALTGLYSWPIGHYADYNISRNLFYGQFSLQSSEEREGIEKEGEEKTANKKV